MTNSPVKIFISGYPLDADEMALAQMVGPFGQISTVKIVRDKQSRKPKGYAFIEMVNLEAAKEVKLALDGLEMKDKKLTVNIVEEKTATKVQGYAKFKEPAGPVKTKRPRLSR